jgi:hypothetical protein
MALAPNGPRRRRDAYRRITVGERDVAGRPLPSSPKLVRVLPAECCGVLSCPGGQQRRARRRSRGVEQPRNKPGDLLSGDEDIAVPKADRFADRVAGPRRDLDDGPLAPDGAAKHRGELAELERLRADGVHYDIPGGRAMLYCEGRQIIDVDRTEAVSALGVAFPVGALVVLATWRCKKRRMG